MIVSSEKTRYQGLGSLGEAEKKDGLFFFAVPLIVLGGMALISVLMTIPSKG